MASFSVAGVPSQRSRCACSAASTIFLRSFKYPSRSNMSLHLRCRTSASPKYQVYCWSRFARSFARSARSRQSEFFHAPEQREAADAEDLGRLGLLAAGHAQRLLQQAPLQIVERVGPRAELEHEPALGLG